MRTKGGFCFAAVAYGGEGTILAFAQADTFWADYIGKGKNGKSRIMKRELLSLYPKNTEDKIEKFLGSSFDVLICANFGPKAMAKLKEGDISLYTFGGGCEMAVRQFMDGQLTEL